MAGRLLSILPPAGYLAFLLLLALGAAPARAEVLQAPIFGRPIPLGEGRVACTPLKGGWIIESPGRVRPPRSTEAIGQAIEVKVASTPAGCVDATTSVTLLATDRFPQIDLGSLVFAPDDGRLEVRGRRLLGVTISWKSANGDGSDTCRNPTEIDVGQQCTFAAGRGASADPTGTTFVFTPGFGRVGPDVITFDSDGRRIPPIERTLVPARVELTRLTLPDAAIDLATGQGEVPLLHPEAVTSATCGPLRCDVVNGKLIARGAAALVHTVDIELRLLPHVFFVRGEEYDARPDIRLPVLHCPMSIVSGPPFRWNADAKAVVKLEGACAGDVYSLRFLSNSDPLKVLGVTQEGSASYVLLRLGGVGEDAINITALRGENNAIALAVAHSETRDAPQPRAALELPRFPNLDFIPNNRPAIVRVATGMPNVRFALLSIDGVYAASIGPEGETLIQGDRNAAGLTALRFGVRVDGLPAAFANADMAIVYDPLQRPLREANLPVPLDIWIEQHEPPLIEMVCGRGKEARRVVPGATARIPFDLRDACRVIFHRDQLPAEYGTQKIRFEIDVLRPDGGARGEAHVSEVLTLRSGIEPRVAWVRGVKGRFDRVVVRVGHEADEAHYIGAAEIRTGAPAAQWSATLGTGSVRLYGTTAIPTGLYRLSDRAHSGVLSLNFGVLSRLTWLDEEGREGFLGLEGGILVMGLANSESETGESLTQVGAVLGLGLAVPIANPSEVTQASVNLHAWYEFDITQNGGAGDGGRHAIIFGPSISIGNVGLDF